MGESWLKSCLKRYKPCKLRNETYSIKVTYSFTTDKREDKTKRELY